ncbi:MAG: TolC family protein [Bacteroidales bacterium]|nr:TolC family protein [Bacteroidales bacterium]
MNNLKILLLATLSLLTASGLEAGTPDTLILEYCHRRAVENYPIMKQKQLFAESTALKNENSDKDYLPQFRIDGRASYQSDVTEVPVRLPGFSFPSPDKDVFDLQLGLNQLIWDGGITRELKNLESADLQINQQQVEVELYKVKERVNGLFFKILLFQKSKEALLINKQTVEEKLRELASGIENGMILQMSADVLEAQILQIDQSIIEIDAETRGTFRMLGELLDLELPSTTFLVLPEPEIITRAFVNQRPEYLLLDLQKNKLELSKNLVTAGKMPKFSGFGKLGYGKPGLNMLSNEFDSYYMVGVGLSWDLFNWNRPENQKKLLYLQQEIVETQKEALDLNVKIQVEDDLAAIEKFSNLIANDESLIILREKIATTASSQLDNGMITSTQYLEELNKATRAKLELETHRIQLSMSKINYLKTIGQL